MANSQFRSKRKVSGRRYVDLRKKRSGDLGNNPVLTHIGKIRFKVRRVLGGNSKSILYSQDSVCVSDGGKTLKLKIESVQENPANVNYTRRNIITKGAIVKTKKGDVKITSRPGQSGTLFGVYN